MKKELQPCLQSVKNRSNVSLLLLLAILAISAVLLPGCGKSGSSSQPYTVVITRNEGPFFTPGADFTDTLLQFDQNGNYMGVFFHYTGQNPIDNLGGMMLGPNGNILGASWLNNRVLEIDSKTGNYVGVWGDASKAGSGLVFPTGIATGSDNNVYVSSMQTGCILKYDGKTGKYIGVFAALPTASVVGNQCIENDNLQRYTSVGTGPDGNLYACLNNSSTDMTLGKGSLIKYDINTGNKLLVMGGLNFCVDVATGPDKLIYVADDPFMLTYDTSTGNARVTAFDTNGNIVRSFDTNRAEALQIGPDGALYVSQLVYERVVRYSTTGVYLGVFADTQYFNSGASTDQGRPGIKLFIPTAN